MNIRVRGAAKPRANEYNVNVIWPWLKSCSGHTILQDSLFPIRTNFAYMNIGVMIAADAVQAAADTIRDTHGVLSRGAAIG